MSKLPYMKLWLGDLSADTDHLSAFEFGIYMRLILHAWKHEGTVPTDHRKLCNITRVEPRIWHLHGNKIIEEFFVSTLHPNGILDPSTRHHPRVVSELHRSLEKSNKNKRAAEEMHAKRTANAHADALRSYSYSQKKEEDAPPAAAPAAAEAAPAATSFLTFPEGGAAPAAPAAPPAKIYAFEQGRVRFTYADYQDLVDSFKHIDVHGALRALAGLCIDKKDWHGFILNALAKRNQVAKERIEIEKSRLESKPKQTWID